MSYSRILIRATNWLGDAVMSLPALHAVRNAFPAARIAILAKPQVAGLYEREPVADEVIRYDVPRGWRGFQARRRAAAGLADRRFDCAILLQNAFDAALIARLARIPVRIGYDRDARGWLLTEAVRVPGFGEIPRHEQFYYLELLRRAGLISKFPPTDAIRLSGRAAARERGLAVFAGLGARTSVVGVSPGAAYGSAKRWPPERFAEAAAMVAAETASSVALFGAKEDAAICAEVKGLLAVRGCDAVDFAGRTSLGEFIDLAAACRVFLTNDSGAMHVASALEVPTVAVFGATDHVATGPTGPLAKVVREPADCSPCLLRECPTDHRCMNLVSSSRVAGTALGLLAPAAATTRQ